MLSLVLKSVRRPRTVLLGLAVLLLLAPSAGAVPVAITYDIQVGYTSALAGGATVLSGTGQLTVRVPGTAGGHVSAGNLRVLSGFVSLTNNLTLGTVMVTGNQFATFGNFGKGAVTAGGAFNLSTVGHIVSGQVHCSGALCGLAGFVPSVTQFLTSGPRPLVITLGNIAGFPSLGPQSFTGMGNGNTAYQNLGLNITGQEVSRAVVPEPSTGLLLGLGLVGLGASGGLFRVRRRR